MRCTVYSWQTLEQGKEECKKLTPDHEKDESSSCLLPSKFSEKIESDFKLAKEEYTSD